MSTLRRKRLKSLESLENRAAPSSLIGIELWEVAPVTTQSPFDLFGSAQATGPRSSNVDRVFASRAHNPESTIVPLTGSTVAEHDNLAVVKVEVQKAPVRQALAANHRIRTDNPVLRFSDFSDVDGATSTLIRHDDGIRARLNTRDLVPHNVITMWGVVFNNPEHCTNGAGACDLSDLFSSEVNTTLTWMDGGIANANGRLRLHGALHEGDTSNYPQDFDDAFGLAFPGKDDGLVDAKKAEIHLIVRDHGPIDAGRIHDQLFTGEFHLDCALIEEPCVADVQFAVHPAPS